MFPSFWQFASVVVEECEESNTANLCQRCYNKNMMAKGDAPLTKLQWYAVSASWQAMDNAGKDQNIQGMWEYFSFERLKAEEFVKEAEKET